MSGLIRKIVVGENPKNAMAYFVGMKIGKKTDEFSQVSAIVYDEKHLYHHGINRYEIYIQQEDQSNVIWKVIENMPCMIEYDLNF